jgi:hypothetical protein
VIRTSILIRSPDGVYLCISLCLPQNTDGYENGKLQSRYIMRRFQVRVSFQPGVSHVLLIPSSCCLDIPEQALHRSTLRVCESFPILVDNNMVPSILAR